MTTHQKIGFGIFIMSLWIGIASCSPTNVKPDSDDDFNRMAHYPERIHVTIQDGKIDFFGSPAAYQPISFDIGQGEQKEVTFRYRCPCIPVKLTLTALYDQGKLVFIPGKHACSFLYESSWREGQIYSDVTLDDRETFVGSGISIGIKESVQNKMD